MTQTSAEDAKNIVLDKYTFVASIMTVTFIIFLGWTVGKTAILVGLDSEAEGFKNLAYMLAIPFFDFSRRILIRKKDINYDNQGYSLLFISFWTAIIIFAVIQALSFASGFTSGAICASVLREFHQIPQCSFTAISFIFTFVVIPVLFFISFISGWIWNLYIYKFRIIGIFLFILCLSVLYAVDTSTVFFTKPDGFNDVFLEEIKSSLLLRLVFMPLLLSLAIIIGYFIGNFWIFISGRLKS